MILDLLFCRFKIYITLFIGANQDSIADLHIKTIKKEILKTIKRKEPIIGHINGHSLYPAAILNRSHTQGLAVIDLTAFALFNLNLVFCYFLQLFRNINHLTALYIYGRLHL